MAGATRMAQYVVGIDLGTSNCAVAVAPIGEAKVPVALFAIPQVVDAGVVESRRLLPSFLYIPADAEFAEGVLALPWDPAPKLLAGAFARDHGAKVPDRQVSSSKSWLCHPGVDRRGPILPWGKTDDPALRKVSPLETAARLLMHIRKAFDREHPDTPIGEQQVVLTVPASFDPAARDLTAEAAKAAGLKNLVLLEEPQAALYAWLDSKGDAWRKELSVGDRVLVVDVGGGTTDFSLIEVAAEGDQLGLRRVAVGDHILLGGDNMDYALAYALKKEVEGDGGELDAWQMRVLVQSARVAKEALLSDATLERHSVIVPSRGSRLFKKTLKAELTRERLTQMVIDGFFPDCAPNAVPAQRRAGLAQVGLPYAADPGITRHLAHFLTRNARPGEAFARPTAILFNGGVLQSKAIEDRVVAVLNGWLQGAGAEPLKVLLGAELDVAVARGAAAYGLVRSGRGLRIRGGIARSYYIGVEQPMPAVPGYEPPISAVCIAPFGMEEGTELHLEGATFGLSVGDSARFRFFSSATRREDTIGVELPSWKPDELDELPPIETTLEGEVTTSSVGWQAPVEVGLFSSVTPLGTLLLECVELKPVGDEHRRWKLEFDVREKA
jgi:molecular chaperone DnaK (HSP70)